jgi:hypothetical protein
MGKIREMTFPIDWRKHHRFMPHAGMCGSTTIWMILHACGIPKPLWYINHYVYKPFWGVCPQLFVAFLSRYFSTINFKTNSSVKDVAYHLNKNNIVVLNWWDSNNGHYSIVDKCEKGFLTMIDSSKERDWMWIMSTKEFKKVWWDTLDCGDNIYHTGFMAWINPRSKILKK